MIPLLVLGAALLHAGWNTVAKKSGDPLVTLWLVILTGGAVGVLALPFVSFPAQAAVPYLLASPILHLFYYLCLSAAYRAGPLSFVYPIARGLGPCVVAAGGYALAGELLSTLQFAGLALASGGIVSLAQSGRSLDTGRRALLAAVATGLIIGSYTYVDGRGVQLSDHPFDYIAWAFVVDAIPLTVAIVVLRWGRLRASLHHRIRSGIIGGVMATTAYIIVLWAMSQTVMASVAALRETSVVFATLLGAFKLREPLGFRRLVAAATVASGLILLHS